MVVGAVVVVVSGFLMVRGGSTADPSVSDSGGSDAFVPYDDPTVDPAAIEKTEPTPEPGGKNPLTVVSKGNEGWGKTTGDTGPHEVTISVTSDGAIYVGYRFWKGKSGLKFAEKSFSTTQTVHRGRGVAQVGAQVLDTATYATCTISVDGVVVTTNRASKKLAVAVCTA